MKNCVFFHVRSLGLHPQFRAAALVYLEAVSQISLK